MKRSLMALYLALLAGSMPVPASATITLFEGETGAFDLSGYVRNLSGVQRVTYDTLGLVPQDTGLSLSVVRFEWHADVTEWLSLDLHQRFFWRVTSSDASLGETNLGIGTSVAPGRTIDLESTIVDEGSLLMTHDIDRLALRFFTDPADIVVGRQAITWGNANLFPIIDIWAQFSPFDLDTAQKPGIDAVRVMMMPAERLELDLVLADKGELEDLSGGARANIWLENADLYVALAKSWNQIVLGAGITGEVDLFTLRLEALLPWHLDDSRLLTPRVTAGFDYFASADLFLTVEYHLNGTGVTSSDEYLGHFSSEAVSRGEAYLLGQHYGGVAVSYKPYDLIMLGASVITNLTDPSVIVSITAAYEVAQDIDVTLGSYVTYGEAPEIALPPSLGSEFGTYPDMFYMLIAAYF